MRKNFIIANKSKKSIIDTTINVLINYMNFFVLYPSCTLHISAFMYPIHK